jgi:hypothetical protein
MLMALFEHSPLPGAPYLLACVLAFWAFLHSCDLPLDPEQVIAKYRYVYTFIYACIHACMYVYIYIYIYVEGYRKVRRR